MSLKRNPVGWFEIYVKDMTRARAFYEAVFEYKLEELPMPGVPMFAFPMNDDAPGSAGALIHYKGMEPKVGGTLIYFSCADCAVEASRAVKNGGSVFKEKFSIGPYGFVALVYDTEGNLIGLHSQT
ncbi:MAG TPA: VOC family protein [Opitutaceae bacterium]|nr:VOC family protein [Opitutaceae bacterium]